MPEQNSSDSTQQFPRHNHRGGLLACDLRIEFPEMAGFSTQKSQIHAGICRSLPNEAIVHQLEAQIPWKHNCTVLDKFKNHEQRIWYIQKTIEHGRSRSVLIHQIETDLYNRQGGALMNYEMSDG